MTPLSNCASNAAIVESTRDLETSIPRLLSGLVTVVFLARGGENAGKSCADFFASYKAWDSGVRHSLMVLMKGWHDPVSASEVARKASQNDAQTVELPDDGFDFGAYFRAIEQVRTEWVCFLNTNSRIAADKWLSKLLEAAQLPGVGAAGSTASWESSFSNAINAFRDSGNRPLWKRARTLVHSAIYYRPFPNPHLRSNAFVARTSLFREFAQKRSIPANKRQAYLLESGRKSFSAYLLRRGYELMVVNSEGTPFRWRDWRASGTFRSTSPCAVLVQDNQTIAFEAADDCNQALLRYISWGKPDCRPQ
jgi:hypothetical protein